MDARTEPDRASSTKQNYFDSKIKVIMMLKIKNNILAALAAMSVLICFVLCGCGVADSGRSTQTAAPASMSKNPK